MVKVNALHVISESASFKTRKSVASSLILSTIMYTIQFYGGCSDYLLSALQVVQNRAARCVTRLPWMTPTFVLLNQCGWLSVRQLGQYHSLVLMFKVRADKKPIYIYKRIGDNPSSNTRQETQRTNSRLLKDFRGLKSETARKTFIPRTVAQWNGLPSELRMIDDLPAFKLQLKTWIWRNVPCKEEKYLIFASIVRKAYA